MPMIDMPVTPASGAEVVIERRVGEAGNRGLSPVARLLPVSPVVARLLRPVVAVVDMPATPVAGAAVVMERRAGDALLPVVPVLRRTA